MADIIVDIPEPFTGIWDSSADPSLGEERWYPKALFDIPSSLEFATRYGFMYSYDDTNISGINISSSEGDGILRWRSPFVVWKRDDNLFSYFYQTQLNAKMKNHRNTDLRFDRVGDDTRWNNFGPLFLGNKLSNSSLLSGVTAWFDPSDELWKFGSGPSGSQTALVVSNSPIGTTQVWLVSIKWTSQRVNSDINSWLKNELLPVGLTSGYFSTVTSQFPWVFGENDARVASRREDDNFPEVMIKTFRQFYKTDELSHGPKYPEFAWELSQSPSLSGSMLTEFEALFPTSDRVVVNPPSIKSESGIYYVGEDSLMIETQLLRPNSFPTEWKLRNRVRGDTDLNNYVPMISGGTYPVETEILDEFRDFTVEPYEWEFASDAPKNLWDGLRIPYRIARLPATNFYHFGKRQLVAKVDEAITDTSCSIKLVSFKFNPATNEYEYEDLTTPISCSLVSGWWQSPTIDLFAIDLPWRRRYSSKGVWVVAEINGGNSYRYGHMEFIKSTCLTTPYPFDIPKAQWDGFTGIKGRIPQDFLEEYEPTFYKDTMSTDPNVNEFLNESLSEAGGVITLDIHTNISYFLNDAWRDDFDSNFKYDTVILNDLNISRGLIDKKFAPYISVYNTDTGREGLFSISGGSSPVITFVGWRTDKLMNRMARIRESSFIGGEYKTDDSYRFDSSFDFYSDDGGSTGEGKIFITLVFMCYCVNIRYGRGVTKSLLTTSTITDTSFETVKWKKTWEFDKTTGNFTVVRDNLESNQPWKS